MIQDFNAKANWLARYERSVSYCKGLVIDVLEPDRQPNSNATAPNPSEVLDFIRRGVAGREPLKLYKHNQRVNPIEIADQLIREGHKIRKTDAFDIHPPIEWGSTQPNDAEWIVERNGFYHVDNLTQAFQISGEALYLDLTRNIMLDWISYNIIDNRPNRYKWHDLTTGTRSAYLAYIIDQTCRRHDVSNEDLSVLIYAAHEHLTQLGDPQSFGQTNHAVFQLLGVAALATALPELRGANDILRRARERMSELVFQQFGNEGIHREQSPYYHLWVYTRLSDILGYGWFNTSPEINDLLKKARANFVHFFHPDGDLTGLGDSCTTSLKMNASMDPSMTYVATGGKQGSKPALSDVAFSESGYAIFRSDWDAPAEQQSYLIFNAAFHTHSHKQADDLTFEWSERGRRLIVDSGKLSYDYNTFRDYVLSTRAHNTIEINGADYIKNRPPYGSALQAYGTKGLVNWASASVVHLEHGVTHQRSLILRKGHWLLVADHLKSTRHHSYTQWFHLAPDANLERHKQGLAADFSNIKETLLIQPLCPGYNDLQITIEKGKSGDRPQGWISPAYGELVENYAIGFTVTGRSATFITCLSLGSKDELAPVSVSTDQKSAVVRLNWIEGESKQNFVILENGRVDDHSVSDTNRSSSSGTRKSDETSTVGDNRSNCGKQESAQESISDFDHKAYWRKRHEDLRGNLRSVGRLARTHEENLAAAPLLRRNVEAALQRLGVAKQGNTILDAGCGVARLAPVALELGLSYKGIDVSPLAIEQSSTAFPDLEFQMASITQYRPDEKPFDIVLVSYVMVHMVDDTDWQAALDSIAISLRSSGVCLLLDSIPDNYQKLSSYAVCRSREQYNLELFRRGLRITSELDEEYFSEFHAIRYLPD